MRRKKDSTHSNPCFWDNLFEEPDRIAPPKPAPKPLPLNLELIYRNAYDELVGKVPKSIQAFHFSYYPYREVRAQAVFQRGILKVRMARVLSDMPREMHHALALILVGKLEKKPCPREAEECFDQYVESEEMQNRLIEQDSQLPPRKVRNPYYGVQGQRYNLHQVFDRVNTEYFQSKLPRPPLSWTQKNSRRRLGYVDHRGRVFISRILDRKSVPRYVIEFIMYHELLHLVVPSEKRGRRSLHHTKAFREAERRFKHYTKARKWMGYREFEEVE